ncbi:hypothetical protein H6F89_01620 [Cyanobacteria bacterium FACHB-63]|nr:hypothetical protein [Cyanobacteria bacterium FACHB-63]
MLEAKRNVLFPLTLRPQELSDLRQSIPTQQRSAVIRELLKREGFISDRDQTTEYQKTPRLD